MRPQKKTFFFCAVIIAISCTTVLSNAANDRIISKTVDAVLKDINRVYVIIEPAGQQVLKSGLNLKKLETAVRNHLKQTGISAVIRRTAKDTTKSVGPPDLRINIDMFEFDIIGQYVFSVQTSIAVKVRLPKRSSRLFKADIWSTGSILNAASSQNISEAVTQTVLEQVEAFIAHIKIKSENQTIIDSNDISAKKLKTNAKPKQTEEVKIKYVSSASSKKFHKQSCRYAKRIYPKNLIEYDTRKQAIEMGKKPCKSCTP